MTVNMNTLRYLLRRSSNNCGLLTANRDRQADLRRIIYTSRVPVEGKSSVCVICMKYRIILYHYEPGSNIIIVYCKHITRAHTHPHTQTVTPPSPFRLSLFDGSVAPNRDGVIAPIRWFRWRSMTGRCFIQINSRAGDSVFAIVLGVFRV